MASPFSPGSPVLTTAPTTPDAARPRPPIVVPQVLFSCKVLSRIEAWFVGLGGPRVLPLHASLGMETVWFLWVYTGLCLGCCWTYPVSRRHPHSLTTGNRVPALAGRRAELTFCVIQMLHAATWDLAVSCQVEERKRPVFWQLPATTCTEAQSLGNLGPAQGRK